MQAIRFHEYGSPDVLRLEEVPTPAPSDAQVLIRVRAAAINPYDWHFMRGTPRLMRMMSGLKAPKDPRVGVDVAGEVEAVGPAVTQFARGDLVFGFCRGALAEYVCAPETSIAPMPANLTFEQAAAVPLAGLTALQGLRYRRPLAPGDRVLVNGASGGVGTFAVQIAKALGARVTAVCSTRNVDLVRSLGAESVVDYTYEDFTRKKDRYDRLLDCVGNRGVWEQLRVLDKGGFAIFVGGGGGAVAILTSLLSAQVMKRKMAVMLASVNKADLLELRGLIESGKMTPVIDSQYALPNTVDAMRYLEQGHARGKVVVSVASA